MTVIMLMVGFVTLASAGVRLPADGACGLGWAGLGWAATRSGACTIFYIQGVTGGTDQTSGGGSLC